MDFKKYSNGSWTDTPVYKYNKTAAGAPNLLINNVPNTMSTHGLTITNNNGVITLNGTNSSTGTWLWLFIGDVSATIYYQPLGKGIYEVGGVPDDASLENYRLAAYYKKNESDEGQQHQIVGTDPRWIIDNTNGDYNFIGIRISVISNTVCDNVVFNPYIKPVASSWFQIEAYRRESGSWTDTPSFGKRKRKVKLVTEETKEKIL